MGKTHEAIDGNDRTRLFVFNGGFLTQRRLRRILTLKGFDIRVGLPVDGDLVGVWGNSPTAHRGRNIASRRNLPVLHIEDAFLRSMKPGRSGEPPLGLLLDGSGVHFDPTVPSDLEQLLVSHPLDDTALLDRARGAIERMKEAHLSKYSAHDIGESIPDPGYVLVLDQTRGDAAVAANGGTDAMFREMLIFAQEEHPGARVIIKTHPETSAGFRPGHYSTADTTDRVSLLDRSVSPWALLDGAVGVYTLSSQMGFEAILAGHKPRVFGQPFYAGWGLTQDENPLPRRTRKLTRAQLFAAAMMLYPTWYDPYRDKLCDLETVLDALEAQARAWREDNHGWTASGMRIWKRRYLQDMFGQQKRIQFVDKVEPSSQRRHMAWATHAGDVEGIVRVEDGFLRSRGLGAKLVPPLSLVTDDLGIYYDPTRPSRLETLITARETLRPDQRLRAERLIERVIHEGLSKYNIEGPIPQLPDGYRILVPGQVEDDMSIRKGASSIRTNLELLQATREANPEAVIVYKPHPDVEAGLREGAIDTSALADVVATGTSPAELLMQVQEVWTITSLIGFEALIRGIKVTTLGAPFYAGWGLTKDLGAVPARRGAHPTVQGLAHAALIDYPRYRDPVTGLPCQVEVVVDRLVHSDIPKTGLVNRLLSKAQGAFASYTHLWR